MKESEKLLHDVLAAGAAPQLPEAVVFRRRILID
jgi:hypothetical protein